MALPTITSITPSAGHTGGRTLVEIVGTNFRLPSAPPAEGPVPEPPPTVRVLFGGVPAIAVWVASTTLIRCITPIHDASGAPTEMPASDVAVENIDDAGVLIPGETVTAAAAFSFERPRYDVECHLEHVTKAFALELDRQVLNNIQWNPHADFDPITGASFVDVDTLDAIKRTFAQLPGIALIDVRLRDSSDHASDVEQEVEAGSGTWIARRAPVRQDLTCTLVGASDSIGELTRMYSATRLFFKKNPKLRVLRDPSDPASEAVEYRMSFAKDDEVQISGRAPGSGVVTFSAAVAIHGILLEDIPGVPTAGVPGTPAGMAHEATVAKGRTLDDLEIDARHRR